jgi:hypothetical protein
MQKNLENAYNELALAQKWMFQARIDVIELLRLVLKAQTEPLAEEETRIVNNVEERYRTRVDGTY